MRAFSVAAGSAVAALHAQDSMCQPTIRERLAKVETKLAFLETKNGGSGVGLIAAMGTTPAANRQVYDEWAVNYEADVRKWGYNLPERVAQLVIDSCRSPDRDQLAILDAGAGDGLVGVALHTAGFEVRSPPVL
jgi:predicted TPR repeat methyltransferase